MTSVNQSVNQRTNQQNRIPVTVSSASSLESYNLPILHFETDSVVDAALSASSGQYNFSDANFSMLPVANPLAPIGERTTRTVNGSGLSNEPANKPPQQSTTLHTTLRTSASGIAVPFRPSSVVSTPLQTIAPITPLITSTQAASGQPSNNTVAEFLYQLTKMLTDNNKETIEWTNGKIEVHNPHKLASEVLHKYFRHSKFASFQRQLNYFGFRKLAGKGKMAPCSYVNEATTMDYRSILAIKRKTTPTLPKEKGPKKRDRSESGSDASPVTGSSPVVNPVLVGILHRTSASTIACEPKRTTAEPPAATAVKVAVGKGVKHQLNGFLRNPAVNTSQVALAQSAVGKGVRHNFVSAQPQPVKEVTSVSVNSPPPKDDTFTFKDPHQLGMDVQNSLNELSNNFQNSLKQSESLSDLGYTSMLRRDDSLVDLAMIPLIEPTSVSEMQQADADHAAVEASEDTSFLDFSQDEDMDSM